MVGDGELRGQVENLIHQYDLGSSFLITGWVDNPTAYMKIMDVGDAVISLGRFWIGASRIYGLWSSYHSY